MYICDKKIFRFLPLLSLFTFDSDLNMFAIKLIFTSLILFEWNKLFQFPILVRSESKFKSCGKRSSKWRSTDKNIFDWPWIASIGQFDKKEIWRHKCGATILNNNTLLTATYCIVDLPDNNQIIVGKYDLNDTFTRYQGEFVKKQQCKKATRV